MGSELRRTERNNLPRHLRGQSRIRRQLRAGLHPSSMLLRASWFGLFLAKRFFGRIRFGRRSIDQIRHAHGHSNVVYVIRTRSITDYLYFNYAFLRHDLPLARFANGVRTFLFRPFLKKLRGLFRRRFPAKVKVFDQALESGQSTLVFLERPGRDAAANQIFSDSYLYNLMDYAKRPDRRPIAMVPLLLVWEKRSESYHKTLFDDVFGSRESPGSVRKFFHLVQNVWQSLLRAGSPTVRVAGAIDLTGFVAEHRRFPTSERVKRLRAQLVDVFDRERRVIVGPPIKPASVIRREILASEPVQEAIQLHVRETKAFRPAAVKKQARKMVREIAANFSLLMIKFLSAFMNPIFDALFKGFDIDADGLERVREIAKDRRLVIVPSHKSHLDYLIISNVFYQHGLMPPHIAAGVNLSFWPLGPIFRRAGAFFLRRQFKGDHLYAAIFTEYLYKLLHEGFPVEFFIEGTRSRTGKLSRPRYGVVSMILRAAAQKRVERIAVVPVSVGYERIVESYSQEMLGAEKKGENLGGVLRATKVLRSKYGRVYVEFEEPIDLDDFVAAHGLQDNADKGGFQRAARSLAYQIIHRIDICTTVTPTAVASMVLLNNPRQATSLEQLANEVGFVLKYVVDKSARLSNSITNAFAARREVVGTKQVDELVPPLELNTTPVDTDAAKRIAEMTDSEAGQAMRRLVQEAMELFRKKDLVKVAGKADARSYVVEDSHRPELNFYRNNITHFFVPEAVFATALLAVEDASVPLADLKARCLYLSRILKYEFCFGPRDSFDDAFRASLGVFLRMGWVEIEEPDRSLRKPRLPAAGAEFLRGVLLNWLESYWLLAQCLEELVPEPLEKKEFFKRCFKRGRQLYLHGELLYYESLSKPTFQNAIDSFVEHGLIVADNKKRTLMLTEESADRWRKVGLELGEYRRKQERSAEEPLRANRITSEQPESEPTPDQADEGSDDPASEPTPEQADTSAADSADESDSPVKDKTRGAERD